jgi:galactokinase
VRRYMLVQCDRGITFTPALLPFRSPRRNQIALSLLRSATREEPGSAASHRLLAQVGELMRLTHKGYTSIGLGAPELDTMLDALTNELGESAGVFGARISGGGSGGTIAILCQERALEAITALAQRMTFGKPFTGLIM